MYSKTLNTSGPMTYILNNVLMLYFRTITQKSILHYLTIPTFIYLFTYLFIYLFIQTRPKTRNHILSFTHHPSSISNTTPTPSVPLCIKPSSQCVWKLYCSLYVGAWWNDKWFIGAQKALGLWTFLSSCSCCLSAFFPAAQVTILGVLTSSPQCWP